MHFLEIVSMLLVVLLSMIVRLPDRHDYCICKYRLESRGFFDDSGTAGQQSPAPFRRLQGVGRVGLVPLHVARRPVDGRDRLRPRPARPRGAPAPVVGGGEAADARTPQPPPPPS